MTPPQFDTTDPVSRALRYARPFEVERIAIRIGTPEGKIRGWRHGSLNLAPWIIRAIADILGLDDAALEQHRECRRRHQEDLDAREDVAA